MVSVNPAFVIDSVLLAIAVAATAALWVSFVRSLRRRTHPVRWAVFLVLWSAGLFTWWFVVHRLELSARQRVVLELQLLYPACYGAWMLRRILRAEGPRLDTYSWSRSDKRELYLATGVVLAGFLIVGGFVAFDHFRGSTSVFAVENDTAATAQVLVIDGCSPGTDQCVLTDAGATAITLRPGQVENGRRLRGRVGANHVLGFVTAAGGSKRCLVSDDGGSHARISQAFPCEEPLGITGSR